MHVRDAIGVFLLCAAPCVALASLPSAALAQGVSEWGIWDSPRRSSEAPRSDDYGDDQRDNDRADPGDDGRDDDDQSFRDDNNGGQAEPDDPRDGDPRYGGRNPDYFQPYDPSDSGRADSNSTPGVTGGDRPYIAAVPPPQVRFSGPYAPGSIVIDTGARKLYYVLTSTSAYVYPIGVGREGFAWTGSEKVSRIQDWPDWYPPSEMRQRKPELPARMLGGIRNPLGVKAIYLGNTLYRIHGTNDPKSIGKAESSGCFRMLNENVLHLASLVRVGTPVTVVRSVEQGVASAGRRSRRDASDEATISRRAYEQDGGYSYRNRPDTYRADPYGYEDERTYRDEARYRRRDPYYGRSDPYWDEYYSR